MSDELTPWVVVGCGRLGTALSMLAPTIGVPLIAAWDRTAPPTVPAQHRLSGPLHNLEHCVDDAAVLLTVSDTAISSVAAVLAPILSKAAVVVHCSGSLPSTILENAGVSAPVGSVHPLLAVADPEEAVQQFSNAAWTIEGAAEALWWARGWLARIDVDPVTIEPQAKPLYHASAVASAGLVVALMDMAFELARTAGLTEQQARHMLLPLARSSLDNLEGLPAKEALTGPVARGDDAVIAAHLRAMSSLNAETRALYELLTERSRAIASRNED